MNHKNWVWELLVFFWRNVSRDGNAQSFFFFFFFFFCGPCLFPLKEGKIGIGKIIDACNIVDKTIVQHCG